MDTILRTIEKVIPRKIYVFFQPAYHLIIVSIGAVRYMFPSNKIFVIGVTGTKGKSSTVEFVNAILEASGGKTAVLSTIRFKIGDKTRENKFKMTMPGRFFVQKFLRDAVDANCKYAIIEMTSEGARLYRHKGVELDTLIFTNLSPEHIESHGSFEKYLGAKVGLTKHLAKSKKPVRTMIANGDNKYSSHFLIYDVDHNLKYSLKDAVTEEQNEDRSIIKINDTSITIPIPGIFNISNALAAITFAKHIGIEMQIIKKGIESLSLIRGRVEKINEGQNFDVIVDYAHTDDSLRKLYETFGKKRKIAVLGSCGGGRDKWKRPVLGQIADEYCDKIILTDEDPYDEDPMQIINDVASGIKNHKPEIILDRREAIREAISQAGIGDVVLISGKGTDPYIMGKKGSKEIWDDATIAREELAKSLKK